MLYQKDGRGNLKRCYFDRIFKPQSLVQKLHDFQKMSEIENFTCQKCNHLIGVPYIYKKEKRSAFLLRPGSFTKKIFKTTSGLT